MHYVCIENNIVVSVLNYQPNVPDTVSVIEITDEQNAQLIAGTHKFDMQSKSVVLQDAIVLATINTEKQNAADLEFLRSTDWKILRHMRQKLLGIPTSLSEDQYLQLEQQRSSAADRIV